MAHLLYQLCIQGEITQIYQQLIEKENRTLEEETMLKNYQQRFFQKNEPFQHVDKWIEYVVNCYQSYFIDVLTCRKDVYQAEGKLLIDLSKSISSQAKSMEEVEDELKQKFKLKGYSFLGGRTSPHYGPYIWQSTESKKVDVELLKEIETVQVFFLDDFLMMGWLDFATFGEIGAGGWASEEGIYCILPRYRECLNEDRFLVSFFKHEAQHYNDFKHYPNLSGKELEYRAKLIELIYYSDHRFLERLIQHAINNDIPHNNASYQIMQQLSTYFFQKNEQKDMHKWLSIHYKEISQYGKKLYCQHTDRLNRLETGGKTSH